jgi:hypothetical protein
MKGDETEDEVDNGVGRSGEGLSVFARYCRVTGRF